MAHGHENLIPTNQRSKEEARELGRKGGIESGKTRKMQKDLKTIFATVGNTKVDGTVLGQQLKQLGFDITDMTVIDALVKVASTKGLGKKASMKDIMIFIEAFAKYTGQEPAKKVEVEGDITSKVRYIEPDEYKAVQDHLNEVIGDTNDEPTN